MVKPYEEVYIVKCEGHGNKPKLTIELSRDIGAAIDDSSNNGVEDIEYNSVRNSLVTRFLRDTILFVGIEFWSY